MPPESFSKNIGPSFDHVPLILAPAGNRAAFLAALAAGADAIYCGLKSFSARMEAKNFDIAELTRLTMLAHRKNTQVYVALNSLVKPDELKLAAKLIYDLTHKVCPDALIVQDLAFLEMAGQMGFKGALHLSTLANVTFPAALAWIKRKFNVKRVVVPRELSVDEIKAMAAGCPEDLDLEAFVHGALCYGVSGRCYWSSWFGGKSGLRGRCVQPCRRLYRQGKERLRYFSCKDLSIDVLAKVLKGIDAVRVWKIEGRKKGPHYVFYTVSAYQLLRDHHHESCRKRDALGLLEQALGRPNTHYNFLSQRPQNPLDHDSQTGSGLLLGRVQGGRKPFLVPRIALMPGDVLRVGYEDQKYHNIQRVGIHIPKKGRLYLKIGKESGAVNGAPVFLTDRRETALNGMIKGLEEEFEAIAIPSGSFSNGINIKLSFRNRAKEKSIDVEVSRHQRRKSKKLKGDTGLWLSQKSLSDCSKTEGRKKWWWLPPVIWPVDQDQVSADIERVIAMGGRKFVLNAPWQMAFFSSAKDFDLWAGPFCNISNPLALNALKKAGFNGAVISPELGKADYEKMARDTPLNLGIVISGLWPLCISRIIADTMSTSALFSSPKGEGAWVKLIGNNYWVYPDWCLDLNEKRGWLEKIGYRLFVHFNESVPPNISMKKRSGVWNWEVGLR